MERQTLLTLFAFMAMITVAQVPNPNVQIVGVDTSTITYHSLNLQGIRIGGTGLWYSQLEALRIGDTTWKTTGKILQQTNSAKLTIDSLQAGTGYDLRLRSWTNNFSDSSVTSSVTAYTRPAPVQPTISYVNKVPSIPTSAIIFTGTSQNDSADVFGISLNTGDPMTTVKRIFGTKTDTVYITNNPNQLNDPGRLVIVQITSGMNGMSPTGWNAFTAPNYTSPSLMMGTITATPDSLNIPITVTSLGNGGNPFLFVTVKDAISLDSVAFQQVVTQSGLITISVSGRKSNRLYTVSARIVSPQGLDNTAQKSIITPNVSLPNGTMVVDSVGYTNLMVTSTHVPNCTWDSCAFKKMYVMVDGSIIDSSNTPQHTFNVTNLTPGGNYWVSTIFVNLANLQKSTSPTLITMKTFGTNPQPYLDDVKAENASTLHLENTTFYVAAGNTSDGGYVVKDMGTGHADTIVALYGLTQTTPLPLFIVNNRIGSHAYLVTPFTHSANGYVFGTSRSQVMPAPEPNPILSSVILDSLATSTTTLGIKVFGSGEGTIATLKLRLYKNNAQVGGANGTFITTVSSGPFEYDYSWDGLDPGTQYKVVTELTIPNGGFASPRNDYFSTYLSATNIDELADIPLTMDQSVRAFNLLGQEIGSGSYREVFQKLRGNHQIVVITPVDETGNLIGASRKVMME